MDAETALPVVPASLPVSPKPACSAGTWYIVRTSKPPWLYKELFILLFVSPRRLFFFNSSAKSGMNHVLCRWRRADATAVVALRVQRINAGWEAAAAWHRIVGGTQQ